MLTYMAEVRGTFVLHIMKMLHIYHRLICQLGSSEKVFIHLIAANTSVNHSMLSHPRF